MLTHVMYVFQFITSIFNSYWEQNPSRDCGDKHQKQKAHCQKLFTRRSVWYVVKLVTVNYGFASNVCHAVMYVLLLIKLKWLTKS